MSDPLLDKLNKWADDYFSTVTQEQLMRDWAEANPHTDLLLQDPDEGVYCNAGSLRNALSELEQYVRSRSEQDYRLAA